MVRKNGELTGVLTSYLNSRSRRDQTIFRNSRFLEFWFVPGVGMRSFQQTIDDNLSCPVSHANLLNVQGPRTEFLRSYVVTNYSMRGGYFEFNPPGTNESWWNKFQFNNMNFYSFGMNECSCENGADISVFKNINLSNSAGQSAQWFRNTFYVNPGATCIGSAYNSQFEGITSSSIDLSSATVLNPPAQFQTSLFIPGGFYPPYSKFSQSYPSDRMEWSDLFSYDALNPSYDTYAGITSICVDPERKINGKIERNENENRGLTIFPTPCQEFATLNGFAGSHITIKNLLGETVKAFTLIDNSYILEVKKMKNGLYIVSDNYGNETKLIIIE